MKKISILILSIITVFTLALLPVVAPADEGTPCGQNSESSNNFVEEQPTCSEENNEEENGEEENNVEENGDCEENGEEEESDCNLENTEEENGCQEDNEEETENGSCGCTPQNPDPTCPCQQPPPECPCPGDNDPPAEDNSTEDNNEDNGEDNNTPYVVTKPCFPPPVYLEDGINYECAVCCQTTCVNDWDYTDCLNECTVFNSDCPEPGTGCSTYTCDVTPA